MAGVLRIICPMSGCLWASACVGMPGLRPQRQWKSGIVLLIKPEAALAGRLSTFVGSQYTKTKC